MHAGLLQIWKNPLLLTGGQDGESVQHSCAHWLLLQHRRLPVLPWDQQSTDEEKPAGMSPKSSPGNCVSFQVNIFLMSVLSLHLFLSNFDLFFSDLFTAQK